MLSLKFDDGLNWSNALISPFIILARLLLIAALSKLLVDVVASAVVVVSVADDVAAVIVVVGVVEVVVSVGVDGGNGACDDNELQAADE